MGRGDKDCNQGIYTKGRRDKSCDQGIFTKGRKDKAVIKVSILKVGEIKDIKIGGIRIVYTSH